MRFKSVMERVIKCVMLPFALLIHCAFWSLWFLIALIFYRKHLKTLWSDFCFVIDGLIDSALYE